MRDPRLDGDIIAAEWAVRRAEGLDTAERAEFDRWLADAPANWRAYKESDRIWSELGEMDLRAVSRGSAPPRRRPALPAAVAATVLVAVLGGLLFAAQPQHSYATGKGQVRTIYLADGSSVILGAGSLIDVNFDDKGRRVWLRRGEAVFDVRHDVEHPFQVIAADTQVTDLGTRFMIKVAPDAVRVDVIQGVVRVSKAESLLFKALVKPARADRIVRGERLESPRGAALKPLAFIDPDQVALWTHGRLVYENASLAEVVADLNRYSDAGVELASSDLGDLRVTAALNQSQIAQFLSSLPATLPVQIEWRADGKAVINPAG